MTRRINRLRLPSVISARHVRLCSGFMTKTGMYNGYATVQVPSDLMKFVARPDHLHPFASAIDSPELEVPDEMVCASCYDSNHSSSMTPLCRLLYVSTQNPTMCGYLKGPRRCTSIMVLTQLRGGTRSTGNSWSDVLLVYLWTCIKSVRSRHMYSNTFEGEI